jgi:putative permease
MTSQNPLVRSFSNWLQRNFSAPGTVALFLTVVFSLVFIELFGHFFLPVLISIVLAYLLNSGVQMLVRWKCPRCLAFSIVYLLFIGSFLYLIFGLLPALLKQLSSLSETLPHAFSRSQIWITDLIHRYPKIFSDNLLQHVSDFMREQASRVGQYAFHFSIVTISNVVQVILYLVLLPLLVFFFLKDSKAILKWLSQYYPEEPGLTLTVFSEVNEKIGCYIKGRVWEILIVGVITAIAFKLLGLQYAVLLGSLVGVSVIIPYVGAVIITIPIVIVGLMEWGFTAHFLYLMLTYVVIIAVDGNLLVPLLFAETMDLHPVVIILSVVVFGGMWGFWGIFFAIPLATFFNAVLQAWPVKDSNG